MAAPAIAASTSPALEAVRWLGPAFLAIIIAGMALSMLATLNGSTMTGARVPFAAARDGYFPSRLAAVHPRFRTPSASLVVQGILAAIFLLLAGTFQRLFTLTLFAEWLFYLLGAATIFIFRRRDPAADRPYCAWGYPVLPALFLCAAGLLLVYTFNVGGAVIIAAGIPIFFLYSRRKHHA
jgi:APA family basic amino acid/polyamine antiporter